MMIVHVTDVSTWGLYTKCLICILQVLVHCAGIICTIACYGIGTIFLIVIVNMEYHIIYSMINKLFILFHDKFLIGRCFWGFVLPVWEYCSAVWCSAADTHLNLLDRVVSSACFLAGGVLNCDLSHRQSVTVLCMLYKIRCNPKHPLCGALPVPYVPVRVTHDSLIAHRYTFVLPRCRTSQYCRTFIPLSVSLWNDLVDPVFDGVGLAGFKSRSNAFLFA